MKLSKIISVIVVFIFIIAVVVSLNLEVTPELVEDSNSPSPSLSENSIRLTNGEWAPFYSEDLQYNGVDSRIVTESFALQGIQVVYGFFPWNRSYEISKNGSWDGAVGWPYSKTREQSHYYSSQPINEGKWVFFYRKDTAFNWDDIDSLKESEIGITLGGWVLDGDDPFTKALKEGVLKTQEVSDDELNFMKLSKKRIDIFPQQIDVGYEQLNKLVREKRLTQEEASNITHHPKPFRKMPLYLLLSKANDENENRIKLFDQGFEQLKESGKYGQFINELHLGAYSKLVD